MRFWWQIRGGEVSFWFDNWTKQGDLYFTEDGDVRVDEIKVKNFVENREWNRQKLRELISEEMTKYIVHNIRPTVEGQATNRPWWMGNSNGIFLVKSAYECVRRKKEKEWWWSSIWSKGVPFKINFLLWRCWKGRIATEDNLKRMKISMASRCCERYEHETMKHLFLTAPIANKLWRHFASCPGIKIGEGLQQIVTNW